MPDLIVRESAPLAPLPEAPALIEAAGARAKRRYYEFFTAQIPNPNTRKTYGTAVRQFFAWCADRKIGLEQIEPIIVAAYVQSRGREVSAPTVKVDLAAISMLFDWLVLGQVLALNPARSVKGPKHIVRKGKAPVLEETDAALLFDSIPTTTIAGLRDRALIGIMLFACARVGAVCGMNVEDYYHVGRRGIFRFLEKGGRHHEVPAHHQAEELVDAYLAAAGLGAGNRKTALFRAISPKRALTDSRLRTNNALDMVKRRARQAGLPLSLCCHSFRATGLTSMIANGATREDAQRIAGHASANTTALYDHSSDAIERTHVEMIRISLR